MARFALAILFAVLVAASRPVASGGAHDLLAIGVLVEEQVDGKTATRTVLSSPTPAAVEAYDALLRSPARGALVEGAMVHEVRPAAETPPSLRILRLTFYGTRSRVGRAMVDFEGAESLTGSAEAWNLAFTVSRMTPAVTAAAARVLLASEDDAAVRDALECLAETRSDLAMAEAAGIALDTTAPAPRRLLAMGVHRSLGGAKSDPGVYARLAGDADAQVAAAAK